MAKIQTRRCVSLSREVYDALKSYCSSQGVSMGSLVEKLVNEHLSPSETLFVETDHVVAPRDTDLTSEKVKTELRRPQSNVHSF